MDLKYNQSVFSVNPSDLLVRINVALKQIVVEKKEEPQNGGMPADGTGDSISSGSSEGVGQGGIGEQPSGGSTPDVPKNTRFFMSAKLDTTRVNRDVNNYVQEVIQHLMAVEGSEMELMLEVSVNAPNGIPSSTVRTVSENCRTLKIKEFGFED